MYMVYTVHIKYIRVCKTLLLFQKTPNIILSLQNENIYFLLHIIRYFDTASTLNVI